MVDCLRAEVESKLILRTPTVRAKTDALDRRTKETDSVAVFGLTVGLYDIDSRLFAGDLLERKMAVMTGSLCRRSPGLYRPSPKPGDTKGPELRRGKSSHPISNHLNGLSRIDFLEDKYLSSRAGR